MEEENGEEDCIRVEEDGGDVAHWCAAKPTTFHI